MEQPRLWDDLKVADGIVGMVVEDLVTLHILPVRPTSVVEMHHNRQTDYLGSRSLLATRTLSLTSARTPSQTNPTPAGKPDATIQSPPASVP